MRNSKLSHLTSEQKKLRKKFQGALFNIVYRIENQESYCEVTVCDEWQRDFEKFYDWCLDNYVEGWQIDKDLLSGDEKIYSPDTCLFVPPEVNAFYREPYNKRGFAYKNVIPGGKTGWLFKTTIHGVQLFGTVRRSQEHAYADYLMFRSGHLKTLSEKYAEHTKLSLILMRDSTTCEIEAMDIYAKYN